MAILNVSTQTELASALRNAGTGDTISLKSGTYSEISLGKSQTGLTITSADPQNQAVVNKIMLRGSSNIEFKDLTLDYVPSKSNGTPFWIESARGVGFDNVSVEGHFVGGYGAGVGLRIKNSADVSLRNSEISDFRNGIYASNSTNVDILDTDFRGMSNDGMLLGGMTDMLIEGNDFRDQNSPANLRHKDSIQFLTSATEAGSRDIVIRDNVIDNKEVSHGIFLTNARYNNGDASAYHSNILIEDNLVLGNQVHGISVCHALGVTIRDNVLGQASGATNIPLINVSKYSFDVLIEGNSVASVPVAQNATWTVIGNDTTSKRLHWYGDPGAPKVSAPPQTWTNKAPAGPADDVGGAQTGTADVFRIGGRMLGDGTSRFAIDGFDPSDGDEIVFNAFGAGVFRGERGGNTLNTWDDGASVRLNSALDFQELVAMSPDVSAATEGDQLVLSIGHGRGVAVVVVAGFGDEYRAADHPELF